jgi:hypothetical protein
MTLLESLASELAAKLKLKYYGYGRYGTNGTVTHHVEFGRLVPVRHEFSVNAAQLKHLEHVEDFVFNHGVNGTRHAMALIHATHQHIHNKESPVRLRTKIDGCVHADTILNTDRGEMTIHELGNNAEVKYVLCHDFDTNTDKFVEILDYMTSYSEKEWVKIELDNGEHLILTEDHEVYTMNRGWVAAGELLSDDDIKIK